MRKNPFHYFVWQSTILKSNFRVRWKLCSQCGGPTREIKSILQQGKAWRRDWAHKNSLGVINTLIKRHINVHRSLALDYQMLVSPLQRYTLSLLLFLLCPCTHIFYTRRQGIKSLISPWLRTVGNGNYTKKKEISERKTTQSLLRVVRASIRIHKSNALRLEERVKNYTQ